MQYIINADDFGRTSTVNQAIVEGFRIGALDRTTVMVTMPCFKEAIHLSEEYNFKGNVGLHINLSSGLPLTENIKRSPSFCTASGWFHGKIFKSKRLQLFLTKAERKAVAEEVQAQIDLFLKSGFTLLHADSHGHIHTFPSLCGTILKVLKKNRFESVRISLNVQKSKKRTNVYKNLINWGLNRFNKKSGRACTYFAPFLEMKAFSFKIKKMHGLAEIMLHPNIWGKDIGIGQRQSYSDLLNWKYNNKEKI